MNLLFCSIGFILFHYSFAVDVNSDPEWSNYKRQFHKTQYSRDEDSYRYELFIKNLQFIRQENENGNNTYELGLTPLVDLTDDERYAMLGLKFDHVESNSKKYERWKRNLIFTNADGVTFPNVPASFVAPDSFSWKDVQTPVEDQGICGSCFAFATTHTYAAHILKEQKKAQEENISFLNDNELENGDNPSVGDILSCTANPTYRNLACSGGDIARSFQYVMDHGVSLTSYLPYRSKSYYTNPGNCPTDRGRILYGVITDYYMLPKYDENLLKTIVAYWGPVAIGIDSSQSSFAFYKKGVYDSIFCKKTLNHAVVITGYGVEPQRFGRPKPYWEIKNSWGTGWGEDGYVKIARDKGRCGIGIYSCAINVALVEAS